MTTALHGYTDLVRAAQRQAEPQRLLFVFVRAILPDGHTPQQVERHARGQGGALQPVLCVDKRPPELGDFAALVAESALTGKDWDLVFAAAMNDGGAEAADAALRRMVGMVETGSIGGFLAFDRSGALVAVSPG